MVLSRFLQEHPPYSSTNYNSQSQTPQSENHHTSPHSSSKKRRQNQNSVPEDPSRRKPNIINITTGHPKSFSEINSNPTTFNNTGNYSKNPNFKVVIRTRPPLPRESDNSCPFESIVMVDNSHKSVTIKEYLGAETTEIDRIRDIDKNPHLVQPHTFTFDYVYGPNSTQAFLYDNTAKPAVDSTLQVGLPR